MRRAKAHPPTVRMRSRRRRTRRRRIRRQPNPFACVVACAALPYRPVCRMPPRVTVYNRMYNRDVVNVSCVTNVNVCASACLSYCCFSGYEKFDYVPTAALEPEPGDGRTRTAPSCSSLPCSFLSLAGGGPADAAPHKVQACPLARLAPLLSCAHPGAQYPAPRSIPASHSTRARDRTPSPKTAPCGPSPARSRRS